MPDAAVEDLAVHQLCAFAARHKASNAFAEDREVVLFIGISRTLALSSRCVYFSRYLDTAALIGIRHSRTGSSPEAAKEPQNAFQHDSYAFSA